VIELLTADDYEVYVDKNILRPLEMHRSYFDTTPYHLMPHRAASYWWRDGVPVAARFDHDTGITVSNGGLNAPLPDMAKYMEFLIGNPARQAVYDGVLKRSSLEQMWTPVVEVESLAASTVKMGLSFFLEQHGGIPFIAHSGGQNAFISHFYVNLDSRARTSSRSTRSPSPTARWPRQHTPTRQGHPRLPGQECLVAAARTLACGGWRRLRGPARKDRVGAFGRPPLTFANLVLHREMLRPRRVNSARKRWAARTGAMHAPATRTLP